MRLGDPIDARIPWVRAIDHLDEARNISSPGPQLTAMQKAAERLSGDFKSAPKVHCVRTLPLTTLLYPTTFAFNNSVPLPVPYVVMTHRCLLVQVQAEGGLFNVLFNPTDYEASRATPYFAQMLERIGERGAKLLTTQYKPIEEHLADLGMSPADIDVIAFDHFHTQDLRALLGTSEHEARFPNAHLLAPRREWEDWDDLHPLQQAWFIADGKKGVPDSKVVLTDNDLCLGDGCLLMRTPGHTTGNQTLFAHGERGVFGFSESGTSADSYSPRHSRIAGLRKTADFYGFDVILNSNTPELWTTQYNNMIMERTLADAVPDRPEFVQMFPSSEVTPSKLAPGIKPSCIFKERDTGELTTTRVKAAATASTERTPAVLH